MAKAKTIRLVLVTGFLGSGKTSVINSLLGTLTDKSVGLILNDFGSIAVDGALVEQSGKIVSSKSLSGGQIFCSCLSGSFIESVEAMAEVAPDLIIVEASGLAKPSPLLEIVSIIQQRTNHTVSYGGMLCVVDVDRFELLSKALKTLEEQIVFSDWFVINKIDLVDDTTLEQVKSKVAALRPLAPIFSTSYGKVDPKLTKLLIESTNELPKTTTDASCYRGWGVHGRPKTCIFLPPKGYGGAHLESFMAEVSSQMLRMKGFLPSENNKAILIDAVGPHVTLSERTMPDSIEPGIVCIHSADLDAVGMMKTTWQRLTGTDATCTPTP
jgi:G3E family GTPase